MKGQNRGPLVVGLIGAGLIMLLVGGIVFPKAREIRGRQEELALAKDAQGQLMLQLQQLKAAARDAAKDRRRLRALESEIPPVADVPSIISLVNRAAADAEVDFVSVSPGSPTAASGVAVSSIPTQITIVGRYFALHAFLVKLESLQRVAKVTSLTVGPGPGGAPQLQATLGAEFYTTDVSSGPGSQPGPSDAPQSPASGDAGQMQPPAPVAPVQGG